MLFMIVNINIKIERFFSPVRDKNRETDYDTNIKLINSKLGVVTFLKAKSFSRKSGRFWKTFSSRQKFYK